MGVLVDYRPACRVDKTCVGLHSSDELSVDQPPCFRCCRDVQGDEVGACGELGKIHGFDFRCCDLLSSGMRVVSDHVQTDSARALGDGPSRSFRSQ